ncbi:hypothetical protein WA026_017823 [Henosepilachna vigintioctopunctata]|uniref:CHK kinase-like domain-containing protein n=1 Tax=Henosepilachna vigintioctopunctata TaxID=420089 RepID=A0AAW1TPV9_9CUCU
MSNFNEEKLKDILRNIATTIGFPDKIFITFSRSDAGNDGYMAEIVRINVTDEGRKKSIDLIAKISMKDKIIRDAVPVEEAYDNEIHAYMTVFPALRNFQLESKIPDPFDAIPKFYSASSILNEEYIIMEDLSKCGFQMLGMRDLLDNQHTEFIMRKYGELHGLSFAFKTLHPETFEKLQRKGKNSWRVLFIEKRIGQQFPKIWKFIRTTMRYRNFQSRHIDHYVENFSNIMDNMIGRPSDKFSCFLHGDCWSNNLMFKYKVNDDHREIEEMKILDWQYCNVGPPVHDLSYSLYCGGTEYIWKNLDKFLRIYHESLSNFLRKFSLDVDIVFPFDELKRQWSEFYHFGAILAGPIWKFRSFEKGQGVDPLNYKADDDSIYLDALAEAECNREYLFKNIKTCVYILMKLIQM